MSDVHETLWHLKVRIGHNLLLNGHPDSRKAQDEVAAVPVDEQAAAAEKWRDDHQELLEKVGSLAQTALDAYTDADPTEAILAIVNHWGELMDALRDADFDNVERLIMPVVKEAISQRHGPQGVRVWLEAIIAYANGE